MMLVTVYLTTRTVRARFVPAEKKAKKSAQHVGCISGVRRWSVDCRGADRLQYEDLKQRPTGHFRGSGVAYYLQYWDVISVSRLGATTLKDP